MTMIAARTATATRKPTQKRDRGLRPSLPASLALAFPSVIFDDPKIRWPKCQNTTLPPDPSRARARCRACGLCACPGWDSNPHAPEGQDLLRVPCLPFHHPGPSMVPRRLALLDADPLDVDRLGRGPRRGPSGLDLLDHILALRNPAEDRVEAVQVLGLAGGDEELAPVGVLARVGHGQEERLVELQTVHDLGLELVP